MSDFSSKIIRATLTSREKLVNELTPVEAFEKLKTGNERFLAGNRLHEPRNFFLEREPTDPDPQPFALIITCMDSRMSPELIFDLGFGDVFVIRLAGPVVNADILACFEFAILRGVKLVVVLTHTRCGAVGAAIDSYNNEPIPESNLADLVANIQSVVFCAMDGNSPAPTNDEFFETVCDALAQKVLTQLVSNYVGPTYSSDDPRFHKLGFAYGVYHVADVGTVKAGGISPFKLMFPDLG